MHQHWKVRTSTGTFLRAVWGKTHEAYPFFFFSVLYYIAWRPCDTGCTHAKTLARGSYSAPSPYPISPRKVGQWRKGEREKQCVSVSHTSTPTGSLNSSNYFVSVLCQWLLSSVRWYRIYEHEQFPVTHSSSLYIPVFHNKAYTSLLFPKKSFLDSHVDSYGVRLSTSLSITNGWRWCKCTASFLHVKPILTSLALISGVPALSEWIFVWLLLPNDESRSQRHPHSKIGELYSKKSTWLGKERKNLAGARLCVSQW